MNDLLIIGAGLAGLTAAYSAAQAGQTVKVIAAGMGVTHWHAGTIDLLGYSADGRGVARPLEATGDLPAEHPYRLLGADRLSAALTDFTALTAELGLPYAGAQNAGDNLWLPSPVGAARPTFLAPAGQAAGDLSTSQPLLIVGIEGMRDFYPKLIAENLGQQGHTARHAFLPLSLLTPRHDVTTVQLAKVLEEPSRLAQLAEALARLVQPGERIGLPAILGCDDHPAVLTRLQEATGVPVCEIPTLPPSVPGIRLHTRLRRRLEEMGVRVEVGMEAINFGAEGERILWVATETSSRPLKHRATNFLLATGGILGGGINSDQTGRAWEVIFDLPLTIPQARSGWFRPHFLDGAGQPVFQGGVAVNDDFQPIHPDGSPVYANLWAAGGTLAGADPIRERSLEGIAISTGRFACENVTPAANPIT
ncbi:MAG: glycerol-3-phosphate dehydrogenase subunit GlpB [Chloroflexi bacterium]|nr:MAG: glycerol-3-phosphate dehydrogenase subunit GlpB [Chloroflexota bacterium]